MMIDRASMPAGNADSPVNDPRRIEKKEKGTTLNNAVVLEKEKQQKREQQRPYEQPKREVPLEIYNNEANAEPLDIEDNAVSVVA